MKNTRPDGYWTYERCKEEALKYKKRAHMQKAEGGAYSSMQKHGWIDELTSHMKKPTNQKINWNYDDCKKTIAQYNSLMEFRTKEKSMYIGILKNNWKELLSDLDYVFRENGYWTYDRCKEEALKYKTKKDFRENSHAYDVIKKNKWWSELCSHITSPHRDWGFYTYDNCKILALKYNTRTDMSKGESLAYINILKNKWYDLMNHMKYKTTSSKRYIYAFEFSDNSVYVGLTFDLEARKYAHLTDESSTVNKHIQKNKNYIFKVITDNPIPIKKAGMVENETINFYRNAGWNILNKARAGGLGGSKRYWTYNKCKNVCLQFKKISEFKKNTTASFKSIIRKNVWYDELTSHMDNDVKVLSTWNDKNLCMIEASKYKTRSIFQKKCSGAYKSCRRNGWLNEFLPLDTRLKSDKSKLKIKINNFW